ncbi:DUF4180 domain-containing protein [Paenibacillus chitinolyticus]|uniref:DUF4180 domain-containing protein n=1 Tax=Paenibacillus chitinolyticus TaxID=79263 RepID=UPI003649D12A
MNITVDQRQDSKIAVVSSEDVVISSVNDALDLMADIRYHHECDKVLLRKEQLAEDFFELKTKLAGDILQKYINYQLKIAIVGDFSGYNSKSLNDFIYECNQGNNVFFKGTEAEALEALHEVEV